MFSGLGEILNLAAHDHREFLHLVGTALHHARQFLRALGQHPVQPAGDFASPLVKRIAHRIYARCRRVQEIVQGFLLARQSMLHRVCDAGDFPGQGRGYVIHVAGAAIGGFRQYYDLRADCLLQIVGKGLAAALEVFDRFIDLIGGPLGDVVQMGRRLDQRAFDAGGAVFRGQRGIMQLPTIVAEQATDLFGLGGRDLGGVGHFGNLQPHRRAHFVGMIQRAASRRGHVRGLLFDGLAQIGFLLVETLGQVAKRAGMVLQHRPDSLGLAGRALRGLGERVGPDGQRLGQLFHLDGGRIGHPVQFFGLGAQRFRHLAHAQFRVLGRIGQQVELPAQHFGMFAQIRIAANNKHDKPDHRQRRRDPGDKHGDFRQGEPRKFPLASIAGNKDQRQQHPDDTDTRGNHRGAPLGASGRLYCLMKSIGATRRALPPRPREFGNIGAHNRSIR